MGHTFLEFLRYEASSKRTQHSIEFWIPGNWIPDLFQWNLDSGFQSLVGSQIP